MTTQDAGCLWLKAQVQTSPRFRIETTFPNGVFLAFLFAGEAGFRHRIFLSGHRGCDCTRVLQLESNWIYSLNKIERCG